MFDSLDDDKLKTILTFVGIGACGIIVYDLYQYFNSQPVQDKSKPIQDPKNGIIYMFDKTDELSSLTSNSVFGDELTSFYKNLIISVPHDKKIKLIMSTRGGPTRNCLELLLCLQNHPAGYTAYIYDHSYSSGSIIALGASEIVMTKYSTLSKIDPKYDDYHDSSSLLFFERNAHLLLIIDTIKSLIKKPEVSDKVIKTMIHSPYSHEKTFTFKECQEMDLNVREPNEDEIKYFAY